VSDKLTVVYRIEKRGERMFWTKIGMSTTNADGTLEVHLDTLPTVSRLHIRDYVLRPSTEAIDTVEKCAVISHQKRDALILETLRKKFNLDGES